MGFGELRRRLTWLWRRDKAASDLAEEMRLHVELRARKMQAEGAPESDARRAALRGFGNRGLLTDASASVWGWNAWERAVQDFAHAFRSLRKTPGFTFMAVATLAAGLGMNTAVFSVVNTVMLKRLPYPEPDRLVSIWEEQISGHADQGFSSAGATVGTAGSSLRTTVSVANIPDYAQSSAFSGLASYDRKGVNLTGIGSPERIAGEAVSTGFFETLGAKPALGRSFRAEDDRPGAPLVAILTYDFWQRRLGGDTDVLEKRVLLDGTPYQVIGVLPKDFRSPFQIVAPIDAAEFFVPAAYPALQWTERGDHEVNLIARLSPGVTPAGAQAALDTVSARLQTQYPQTNGNFRAVLAPLEEDLTRSVSGPLWILLGASGLIVMLTTANLANLMLVRAVRRRHESSVRMALGAGRWGLARQYLAESAIIAAAGCAAAIGVGLGLMRVLVALAPEGTPRVKEAAMDWRVFGFAAAVATLTGLVFGLIPALQASRAQAAEALKTAARSSGARSQARWRAALTVVEIALSLILLVGAGLLLRSFMVTMGVDLGFQPERVLAMAVNLPDLRYPAGESRLAFFQQLEQRVQALPGVQSVAFANRMPLRGGWGTSVFVDTAPETEFAPDSQAVSAGYFETLGIPLLRGRRFTAGDRDGSMPVAIVNQAFARETMGGRDPVGHRLRRGSRREIWCQIVGMVGDIRRGGKLASLKPQVYFAAAQTSLYPVRLADLAVRTSAAPRRLVNAIQRQVWALDKDQPVTNVRTMEEIISESAAQNRFEMALLIAFAGVAVLLTTIGLFGVLSYLVSQRKAELGIRMALGASPGRIVMLVLRQAVAWIAAGVALGAAGSLALTRYIEALLFRVKIDDLWTYSAAIPFLVAVSLASALIPAMKGSRADPATALRQE